MKSKPPHDLKVCPVCGSEPLQRISPTAYRCPKGHFIAATVVSSDSDSRARSTRLIEKSAKLLDDSAKNMTRAKNAQDEARRLLKKIKGKKTRD